MVNVLPAILIGGPPHAGKSVLFYSLTRALDERGIPHHAIRACPDGEGDWSQESDQQTVKRIRIKLTKEWPESFVQRICRDLDHRCFPLLVDVGGDPRPSQLGILRCCTHSILLLRADRPEATKRWHQLVQKCELPPLAEIYSQLDGDSILLPSTSLIEGTITDLIRDKDVTAKGLVFDALVECIADLFLSCAPHDLENFYLEQAPSAVFNLYKLVPPMARWQPEMLPSLITHLPATDALSVYGSAPNWVTATIAAYTGSIQLHRFDPRLGWVQPLPLALDTESLPEIQIQTSTHLDATLLEIALSSKHLDYFQPDPLPFPPLPPDAGLIISGSIPQWLLTALTRLYRDADIAWIATYEPRLQSSIVIYSRVATHTPGMLIPLLR